MRKIYYFIVFFYLASVGFSYALETDTHKLINEKISKTAISDFALDRYFIDNIDPSGIAMNLGDLKAWEWLRDGGEYEDIPAWYMKYLRSVNHFHNPLEPDLENAGFSGIWGSGFLNGESALVWSQKAAGTQSPGGQYSWHDVRGYFYYALTAGNSTDREGAFAETFRGLGQLMHLVQDMSVPEHTRDDGHYRKAYEDYVLRQKDLVDAAVAIATADPSKSFALTALSQTSPIPEAPVPIARLFDSEQYTDTGNNPEVTLTPNIGLAEYTSANFVSGDTIFAPAFPYPKRTSVTVVDRDIADPANPGATVKRPYYFKNADGEQNYLLAGVDYFYVYRQGNYDLENMVVISPMDDYVFADYARLLLPRAVGYSATLLHYFFRGEIDIEPAQGIPGSYVIKNNSSEEMRGDFALYFDEITPDENTRTPIGTVNLTIPANGTSAPIQFSLPKCSKMVEPGKFILVFRGDWGEEKQIAVAGRVVTLPLVGWFEEWDQGLTGNHPWLTTDIDLNGINSPNGQTINLVSGGKLVKENIRDTGSNLARVNQTVIMDAFPGPSGTFCIDEYFSYCFPNDFGVEFPLTVTPNTWVSIKLDELFVNAAIPYQSCGTTSGPGEYQGVLMKIRDQGGDLNLFFTGIGGQLPPSYGPLWASRVTAGQEMSFNLFSAFELAGRPLVAPVNLLSVNIVQALGNLCTPSTMEHRQRMLVDYIRIEN